MTAPTTQRQWFVERQADLVPIVLAVPETYTPKDYLDEELTSSGEKSDEDSSSG